MDGFVVDVAGRRRARGDPDRELRLRPPQARAARRRRTASCSCTRSRSRSGSSASMPTARSCGAGARRSAVSHSTCSTSSSASRASSPIPNFRIELALICEEEIRGPIPDGARYRYPRDWWRLDRRLLEVVETRRIDTPADLLGLLPDGLPEPFTTADIVAAHRTIEAAGDARRLLPRAIRRDRAVPSPRAILRPTVASWRRVPPRPDRPAGERARPSRPRLRCPARRCPAPDDPPPVTRLSSPPLGAPPLGAPFLVPRP